MIGQNKLISNLDNYNLDNFPRSLILIGDEGCGKHSLCNLIGNHLKLSVIDITNNLNLESITNIYLEVEPKIYIIDASNISIREQNLILKFVEEPLKNSYIILLCKNLHSLLDTLITRCQKWVFKPYAYKDLMVFASENLDDKYFKLFNTPGKLLSIQGVDLIPYEELSTKIVTKIGVASLPNTLSIPDKIAFKNEKGKLNFQIFKDILCYYLEEERNLKVLDLVREYKRNSLIPQVNQKMLFENFLISLWKVYRYGA